MTDTERNGMRRILWRRRAGFMWLPLLGFGVAAFAAIGYSERVMLGVAIGIFLIAGALNTLYMFSLCPRCHRLFNSIPKSRWGFIWPVGHCRHCGLSFTDEDARKDITPAA
jgi:hypothetical protein